MDLQAPYHNRLKIAGVAIVLLIFGGSALLALSFSGSGGSTQSRSDPLGNMRFYADPQRPVVEAMRLAHQQGRTNDARLLNLIASQPTATWLAGSQTDASEARRVTTAAAADKTVALLVAYNIPHRDACGSRSSGGAVDGAAYHAWLHAVAASIHGPAVVVVEPDAVGDLVRACLKGFSASERTGLLRDAIQAFKQQPSVTAVYLDAGNPKWFPRPADLVPTLRQSGVGRTDGVAVNVSNFVDTDTVVTWATQLTSLLDTSTAKYGAIIDTSRNGNGAFQGTLDWCNPPGRALGDTPTTDTGHPGIDAYVWVKPPGDSDGQCRGGPTAGTFWLNYALGLASHGR